MTKDFLMVSDFTSEELLQTLDIAIDMKADKAKYAESLKGKTLALIFEKPSLRTRASFDIGIQQLGGISLHLSPNEISLGKRESVEDIGRVLGRMTDGIMIRTFGHSIVDRMAACTEIPIINGLTDYSHPCQAMADFLTIKEVKGDFKGRKLVYVGDGNNVAHSLMFAGARFGTHVTVACPKGYEPNMRAWEDSRAIAKETGAKIEVEYDPIKAMKDADIVYTDVWASMGQEEEAAERKKIFMPYQVNANLFKHAKKDAMFLHCLPAHRGEEVASDVIDTDASYVFQEAENRLHAQKAIMFQLMGGKI